MKIGHSVYAQRFRIQPGAKMAKTPTTHLVEVVTSVGGRDVCGMGRAVPSGRFLLLLNALRPDAGVGADGNVESASGLVFADVVRYRVPVTVHRLQRHG